MLFIYSCYYSLLKLSPPIFTRRFVVAKTAYTNTICWWIFHDGNDIAPFTYNRIYLFVSFINEMAYPYHRTYHSAHLSTSTKYHYSVSNVVRKRHLCGPI